MNISFALTTAQIRNRTKDVTRRLGWKNLKAGQILGAVEKCQGLKKGQHPVRLCTIRTVRVNQERLDAITPEDCKREGFPSMTPTEFITMFCEHNKCKQWHVVTRIEFEYVQ